jgi:hypothetical protein
VRHVVAGGNLFFFKSEIFNWFVIAVALAALGILFFFFEKHNLSDAFTEFVAFAALDLGSAGGVFANKLALGLGTKGFLALPVADGFGTNGLALGFGHLAVGHAMGRVADVHAFGTVHQLASFVRTHRTAVRTFALDVADGSLGLQTAGVAFGGFAHGRANSITSWVVTLPRTFRMAFLGFYS